MGGHVLGLLGRCCGGEREEGDSDIVGLTGGVSWWLLHVRRRRSMAAVRRREEEKKRIMRWIRVRVKVNVRIRNLYRDWVMG